MNFGKTIRIYLADGTPTGIRHAEVVNWTGQAIICPRGRVGELAQWLESQRPGVYVLFGEDESGSKEKAYIGEAENVLTRLQSHLKNKDFWDRVVFFTSKDENLTKAHVKYLEARMVELTLQAGRVVLENGTAPQLPSLPRADRDAMEEFLDPARILLAALGSLILHPLPKKPQGGGPAAGGKSGPLSDVRLHLNVSKTGVVAEGVSTDEGFVVYSGSIGPLRVLDSLSKGWRDLREELISQKSIVPDMDKKIITFVQDVLFKSPSAAAAVVCGGVRNGRDAWRDEQGTPLKQLEENLAASEGEPAFISDKDPEDE